MYRVQFIDRLGFTLRLVARLWANFTPVPRPGHRVGLPWPGDWQVLVDSDNGQFGGSGYRGQLATVTASTDNAWQGQPASAAFDLPPLGVVWLGAARP